MQGSRLIAVAETDFEQQITELSDENHKLDTKLQEMELNLEHKATENRLLNEKLNQLEIRMSKDSSGVQGQLSVVASQVRREGGGWEGGGRGGERAWVCRCWGRT